MLAVLGFLTSPLGRLAAGFVLGAAMLIGAFGYGHHVASRACKAEALKAELAAKQQDLDAAHQAAAEAEQALRGMAQREAENEKRTEDYAEALKKRPAGACILTPDDFPHGMRRRSGR